jgi:phosphoglycerate dehydrogenase-like enzyme
VDLLIVDSIEPDVRDWLAKRHEVRVAPQLARDPVGLRKALAVARSVLVPGGISVDAAFLALAPRLRAVARVAPGADGIDLDACTSAQVEVVRALVASAGAEAEFMLGSALKLLRRLPEHGRIREGRELASCTVGLIGMTPAARSLSQLLVGFGCPVIGYDPAIHASDGLWNRWRVRAMPLRDVFSHADVVFVQLQYYTRYKGLLGDRLLPHCKSNQVIVCISPSAVFDEEALARALDNGVIAAAWLDHPEPGLLDPGRPLAGVRRLCTSRRLAAGTREARRRSAWTVAKRLDELLSASAEAVATPAAAGSAVHAGDPASP